MIILFSLMLDKVPQKGYNIVTGTGKPSNKERSIQNYRREVNGLTEAEIEKLLEAIRAALASDSVEKITLTVKPRKPKQP